MENINIIAENYSNSIINSNFDDIDGVIKNNIKIAIIN